MSLALYPSRVRSNEVLCSTLLPAYNTRYEVVSDSLSKLPIAIDLCEVNFVVTLAGISCLENNVIRLFLIPTLGHFELSARELCAKRLLKFRTKSDVRLSRFDLAATAIHLFDLHVSVMRRWHRWLRRTTREKDGRNGHLCTHSVLPND